MNPNEGSLFSDENTMRILRRAEGGEVVEGGRLLKMVFRTNNFCNFQRCQPSA